jgi:hypothetical protein
LQCGKAAVAEPTFLERIVQPGAMEGHLHERPVRRRDRFLLCRMEPDEKQFLHAIKHANRAPQMRARLVEAVTNLFAVPLPPPRDISDREIKWLNNILQIAVRLRGAVKRDYRTRELEDIYGTEGTARFGKALERVPSGLDCLGVKRSQACKVIRTIAFDSVPPNRLSIYRHLKSLKGRLADTTAIAKAVKLPTITARRALEELVVDGLAERDPARTGQGGPVASSLTESGMYSIGEEWLLWFYLKYFTILRRRYSGFTQCEKGQIGTRKPAQRPG